MKKYIQRMVMMVCAQTHQQVGGEDGDHRWRVLGKKAPKITYMDRAARCFAYQERPAVGITRTYMHTEDPLDPRLHDDE